MKQYVIDEIRPADYDSLKAYLDEHFNVPGYDGLYRILLPAELLNEVQKEHIECLPLYFAVELLPDRLACEFLIRTNNRIRCDCIEYASTAQRNWLIDVIDATFHKLGILT